LILAGWAFAWWSVAVGGLVLGNFLDGFRQPYLTLWGWVLAAYLVISSVMALAGLPLLLGQRTNLWEKLL
jgi:hypothetical protein